MFIWKCLGCSLYYKILLHVCLFYLCLFRFYFYYYHLLGEVGSQKYKVAANFGLPIMTPQWIIDIWETGQHKQLHASDSCYDRFKCPVFKGLIISVSQLSAEERLTLKKVIEENGGSYSGALKAHETTHLVLSEPTGDKYRFAKSWKVICVNVKWIYDSVEAGYCRDETLYALDESSQFVPKRSTPKKDHTVVDLPLVDCSVIVGHPAVSHLDETMRSEVSLPVTNKLISFVPLDEFNLSSLPKNGQFLDGCKIFLTGFNSAQMDKLRKIVNSGGAMRFNKYTDSVSHVVCGELSEDFLKSLRSSSVKPFVVSYKWLLECCKSEKLVDEKPFLCMDVTTLSPEKNEENIPKKEISLHVSHNSSQIKKDDFTSDNMTDIFKQYINDQQLEDDKENKGAKIENKKNSVKTKSLSLGRGKNNLNSFEVKSNDPTVPVIDLETEVNPLPQNVKAAVNNDFEVTQNEDMSSSENLFSGIKFIIVGFRQKDSEILSNFIETHSGVISSQKNTSSDLAIVPLIWHDMNLPVSNIVTNCWLQKCVEESRLFDFDENALFRPFAIDLNKKPFESFVISFSQYVGTERDCLMHLAESLGAICQEYFVRKANPAKGVLSNTHLVVSMPSGSKYEASKKWKIPAITKKWVIDTAKFGVVPPIDNYLVEKFPELPICDEEPEVVQNISVVNNEDNARKNDASTNVKNRSHSLPNNCTSENSHPNVHEVSSKETSLKNISSLIDNGNSEHDLSRKSFTEIKIPEKDLPSVPPEKDLSSAPLEKNLHSALPEKDLPSAPLQHSRVTELCNESRRASIGKSSPIRPLSDSSLDISLNQSHNFKFRVSGILKDLDASVSTDSFNGSKRRSLPVEEVFSRNLASALQRLEGKSNLDNENDSKLMEDNNSPSEKLSVLKGVVIYVSRKLSNMQIELNDAVRKLGGSYIWSYDDTCTHFVFVGKPNDITKEFREARSQGKKIVSPEWVYACKEKESHVDEDLYPHTYKAGMTLSQQISILKAPPPTLEKAPLNNDVQEPKSNKSNSDEENNDNNNQLQSNGFASAENEEVDFNKQLNELLVAAKSAKKRQSKRMANSASSSPVADISPIPKYQRHLSDVYIRPANIKENANEDPDTCSQHSQSYPIMWDDPTGRLEREKIAARAAKNAEELKKAKKGLEKPKTRKFMFTNITDSLKAEYIDIVKKLGGETSDEKAFDITATHLILANPIKNEKFLSSVASGKWVLHPLYLSASVEQNKFVSEEEYEWGGPSTERLLKNIPSSSAKIAKCPYRWRTKVQKGTSTGAFDSWKVVVHADDKTKLSTYTKILMAGGAEIISSENTESALDRITHVFVDVKKRSQNKIDLSSYVSHNIKCIKPEYLAFYLIDDPPPDIDSFLLPETKEQFSASASSSSSKKRNLSTGSRQNKKTRMK